MKKIFFLFFFFSHPLFSEDYYHCKTTAHNGLEFLGKDYGEIINYLGLGDFKIKLSRSREDIIREQNEERKNKKKQFFPKYSHFFELIIIKASGYPDVMHCSWMHDVRFDKKENRNFNCVEEPNKKDVFSLDYAGNFIYSSSFDDTEMNKSNQSFERKTLHSLFGKCRKIEENK